MKPVVGVMPLCDDDKDSLWMLPGYLEGLEEAGMLPLILPLTDDEEDLAQMMGMCDGFLFTGGHDVSPEVYGEEPLEGLIAACEGRDRMEAVVLRAAIDEDKPLLGICRGIQYVNAALGGTLYQDLDLQHPSDIEHHQQPPYDVPIHEVTVLKESPLYACLQKEQLGVNSYHHQAIKDLAPDLKEMAVSPDGLIEAVYLPGHRFLWAVQWHPEFFGTKDDSSRRIFHAFADAMK